jgi:uncharacterized protein (DUF2236 family)
MARWLAERRRTKDTGGDAGVPVVAHDSLVGIGLAAGGANVIMQLARLPIGRGVAESRVESGRVDRHPIKRLRTTSAYLLVAMLGSDEERAALRRQIDQVHAQVHSRPDDPVAYNAFDRDLQLWVAACLYKGVEDVYELYHGVPPDRMLVDEVLYPYGMRLGTTLQMPPELWPADRDAFEAYWRTGVAEIRMDEVTRSYLRTIADLSFLVAPLGRWGRPIAWVLRPIGNLITVGFLPPEFRAELGLPWDERRQRRFDHWTHLAGAVARHLPRPLREFPLNVYWRDTKRRLATGRPVV